MTISDYNEIIEELGFWGGFTERGFSRKANILTSIVYFLKLIIKFSYLFIVNQKKWNFNVQTDIELLVIYLTANQEKAVNSWLVYERSYKSISNSYNSNYKIPWGRFAFFGLKNIIKAFIFILRSGNFKNYMPWLEEFARYYAGKDIATEMFRRLKPSFILISNDHSGVSRGINRVAKQNGIKIVYTQHACIGKGFPRLNFDLSMLDGLQSHSQYLQSGKISGQVVITGRQKKIFLIKTKLNNTRIGLATNSLDNLKTWEEIIENLVKHNYIIKLRCHPAEKRRKKWAKIAFNNNIEMDEGGLNDFIEGIDVLVAGLTGTILDAYIMGVPTVYFEDQKSSRYKNSDYYNYEQYGICVRCDSPESISKCIDATLERGVNVESALMYDAGVKLDPINVKNTILKNFVSNKEDLMLGNCMPVYKLYSHEDETSYYAPE